MFCSKFGPEGLKTARMGYLNTSRELSHLCSTACRQMSSLHLLFQNYYIHIQFINRCFVFDKLSKIANRLAYSLFIAATIQSRPARRNEINFPSEHFTDITQRATQLKNYVKINN